MGCSWQRLPQMNRCRTGNPIVSPPENLIPISRLRLKRLRFILSRIVSAKWDEPRAKFRCTRQKRSSNPAGLPITSCPVLCWLPSACEFLLFRDPSLLRPPYPSFTKDHPNPAPHLLSPSRHIPPHICPDQASPSCKCLSPIKGSVPEIVTRSRKEASRVPKCVALTYPMKSNAIKCVESEEIERCIS